MEVDGASVASQCAAQRVLINTPLGACELRALLEEFLEACVVSDEVALACVVGGGRAVGVAVAEADKVVVAFEVFSEQALWVCEGLGGTQEDVGGVEGFEHLGALFGEQPPDAEAGGF